MGLSSGGLFPPTIPFLHRYSLYSPATTPAGTLRVGHWRSLRGCATIPSCGSSDTQSLTPGVRALQVCVSSGTVWLSRSFAMYVDFSTFQKQNCYSKGNTNFSAPNSHSIFLSRIFFLKFFVELHGESQLELFESCFPSRRASDRITPSSCGNLCPSLLGGLFCSCVFQWKLWQSGLRV